MDGNDTPQANEEQLPVYGSNFAYLWASRGYKEDQLPLAKDFPPEVSFWLLLNSLGPQKRFINIIRDILEPMDPNEKQLFLTNLWMLEVHPVIYHYLDCGAAVISGTLGVIAAELVSREFNSWYINAAAGILGFIGGLAILGDRFFKWEIGKLSPYLHRRFLRTITKIRELEDLPQEVSHYHQRLS